MSKKCTECNSHEATEYINPFHIVHICHQGNMVINDLALAEKCECYEMDCSQCSLTEETACADCCRDWDNKEDD